MQIRYFLFILSISPMLLLGQTINWEEQNLTDEQAILSGSVFSDAENLVNLTVSWDTLLDNRQSTFKMVPQYGGDFLSFEEDMQGGETGYLTLGFDNSLQDTNDILEVVLRFDQPVLNLQFTLLDIDQGLDTEMDGANWDDAVEVLFNDNQTTMDTSFYSLGPCVQISGESFIDGFDGDSTCMGVPETDSSANVNFDFGDTLVSQVIIKYTLTMQSQDNPSSQQIGLSDLSFTSTASALPVELTSFEAIGHEDEVLVEVFWETAQEINSEYFQVEHSTDGRQFHSIGQLDAQGNSNKITKYQFNHEDPNLGNNYYRLKSIDLDGSIAFSSIKQVTFLKEKTVIYPNPMRHQFIIHNAKPGGIITISNLAGQEVYRSINNASPHSVSSLQPGIYLLSVTDEHSTYQQKIIKR